MPPLVIFTLAWAAGIWLVQAVRFSPVWFLLLLPLALVLLVGWGDDRRARRTALAAVALLLGVGRFVVSQPHIDEEHVAFYVGRAPVTVEGVVRAEPDPRARYTNLRLDVERLVLPDGTELPVRGQLLVKAPPYAGVRYGDRLQTVGDLEVPPVFAGFSYRDYLARQGIHALLRNADVTILESHQASPVLALIFHLKARGQLVLHRLLPEPQSSLLVGILLGVESGIPKDVVADFEATGTSHIVAISGFNLTIVAGVLAVVARRLFGRRAEFPVALIGIALYTILVGAAAAVLRAALMSSLALWGRREERRVHGLTSLMAAALILTLINPLALWDVGFQLSFMATLGLILYTEPLTAWMTRQIARVAGEARAERVVGWIGDALLVTVAAQITTTPILVAVFRRFSVVTLLTNFLVIPVQPLVMLWGGLALMTGLLVFPLGQLLAWIAWVFLTYTLEVVHLTAQIPFASVELGNVAVPLVWGYYGALFFVTWWASRAADERRLWRSRLQRADLRWAVTGVALLALIFLYLASRPDGRLHVFFLDVGHGDAVFVQTPSGRQILIDGGPDTARLLSRVGRRMPFWDRRLDLVILTSPDDDRLAGLVPVLERYTVDFVSVGGEVGEGSIYARWQALLDEREPGTVGMLRGGMVWPLDRDVTLHTLWPISPEGQGPLVLQLRHGETSFLLSGDATTLVEEGLVAGWGAELDSAVLQLARQGATTSSLPAFLQLVSPEVAVVGVEGRSEYDDRLSPAVRARLLDVPLYRTDRHGTVEVVSDGHRLWVLPERNIE